MSRAIYCCDVGTTLAKKDRDASFAWARTDPQKAQVSFETGRSIERLAERVVEDLEGGTAVALGLEAPLSIPVPEDAASLSRARGEEGQRAWSAPAGLAVASLAVHQAAWIFKQIRKGGVAVSFSLDVSDWPCSNTEHPLHFVWEAFVSEAAHGTHVQDAVTGAMYFREHEANLLAANAVECQEPLSLVGAAALWSGLSSELELLASPALVLRPATRYQAGASRAA